MFTPGQSGEITASLFLMWLWIERTLSVIYKLLLFRYAYLYYGLTIYHHENRENEDGRFSSISKQTLKKPPDWKIHLKPMINKMFIIVICFEVLFIGRGTFRCNVNKKICKHITNWIIKKIFVQTQNNDGER